MDFFTTIYLKCSWPLDAMPKKYLTVKEVARLLGVTPLTVRNWDAKGKLTAYRHPMNNYRLYSTDEIENLMRELEISKVAHKVPNEPASRERIEQEKSKVRKLKIDVL